MCSAPTRAELMVPLARMKLDGEDALAGVSYFAVNLVETRWRVEQWTGMAGRMGFSRRCKLHRRLFRWH